MPKWIAVQQWKIFIYTHDNPHFLHYSPWFIHWQSSINCWKELINLLSSLLPFNYIWNIPFLKLENPSRTNFSKEICYFVVQENYLLITQPFAPVEKLFKHNSLGNCVSEVAQCNLKKNHCLHINDTKLDSTVNNLVF